MLAEDLVAEIAERRFYCTLRARWADVARDLVAERVAWLGGESRRREGNTAFCYLGN
jgi:hypothetical protein